MIDNIRRREFLKCAALGASYGITQTVSTFHGMTNNNYDRFGGFKAKKFKATGFFRTEHDGKRWWLVTPEGHAFLSLGVNHYHAGWWIQEYNRDHWVKTFNAKRPWDEAWKSGFRKAASDDLKRLGLNTLGIHTDSAMLNDPPSGPILPYVRNYEPVILSHYLNPEPETYVDIFAPAFRIQCDAAARKTVAPYVNDPMLLGYSMADCPILTDGDVKSMGGTTWPRVLRNLGPNTPGKQAYVFEMRSRYPDIRAFNTVYTTAFPTWDDLARAENWRPADAPSNPTERDDNHAFMLKCVDRYYNVAKAALRRVDSNHLFFGDKINGNTDCLDKILEVTGRHTDLVFYQYYARWPGQKALLDTLASKVNIPFLNGDSAYTVPGPMMPAPYGPHAVDHDQRSQWLREFCENAFARPEFVGWHMCGMIDTWKTMRGKEKHQHQGLMTVTGEFYPEMEQAIQDISERLYEIGIGSRSKIYRSSVIKKAIKHFEI
ncbi:MAG: hypothetical protein ACYSO7_07410 [Planctomycetota bacterium]|jgi:hypothetical protein